MKFKKMINWSLLRMALLILPLLFAYSCQEHGDEVEVPNQEVMFTKYSEVSTLMKTAVEEDDDKQCVFYQYPIIFYATFSNSTSIETIIINNDDELLEFFDQLASTDQIRIDFPIYLIGEDNELTVVNNLDQLKETLQVAIDACSGNVAFEYCHPNNKKVNICHNGTTICVSVNAINAHLEHGDVLGTCE